MVVSSYKKKVTKSCKKKCSALKCNICVPKCLLDEVCKELKELAGSAQSQAVVKSLATQTYRIQTCGVKKFFKHEGVPEAVCINDVPEKILFKQTDTAGYSLIQSYTPGYDSKLIVKGSVKGGTVSFYNGEEEIASFDNGEDIDIDEDVAADSVLTVQWELDEGADNETSDLKFLMIVQTCAKEFEKCWKQPKPCHKPCDCDEDFDF